MRKAISPVIATVILIAITIMIGAAVGGWLLGLWGNFAEVESIVVYPDAKLQITNNGAGAELSLAVKNKGTKDVRIVKVYVVGVGECSKYSPNNPMIIRAGKPGELKCEVVADAGKKFVAGASYAVKVVTESGGVYRIDVAAKEMTESNDHDYPRLR